MSPSIEDVDFSTDQTTRISRRVGHGVYRLTHGDEEVGQELWGIFALLNGGYKLLTEIDLLWPMPNQQRASLDLGEDWGLQLMWAQVDLANTRKVATYAPAGNHIDIEIVESRLHAEEDADRRNPLTHSPAALAAHAPRITPRAAASQRLSAALGKASVRRQLPYGPTTHVDFDSALFNFLVLQRLQLIRGAQATFDTIVVMLPDLEPLTVQQTYCYVQDGPLGDDPALPPARKYTISERNAQGAETALTTFWTDAHGIPIRQELVLDGVKHGCEMSSYRWQG